MSTRHFLSLLDFSPDKLKDLLARAIELKKTPERGQRPYPVDQQDPSNDI